MNRIMFKQFASAKRQSGVVTTFTGVMILVLLTLMMFFAIRVGVLEQRISGNEMRQKLAFHAAESGIHYAKEYIRKNLILIASDELDALSDGTDGWFESTGGHWRACADASVDLSAGQSGNHPCFAESRDNGGLRRMNLFYYRCKQRM